MITGESITRSALWGTFEATGQVVLQIITLVVLARFLNPSEFGLATLAIAVVHMMNLPVEHLGWDDVRLLSERGRPRLPGAKRAVLVKLTEPFREIWR